MTTTRRAICTLTLILAADTLTSGDYSCVWLALAWAWNFDHVAKLERVLVFGKMRMST